MNTAEQLELCARAALAADFDPVPWDEAPQWRRRAALAIAHSAIASMSPDQARMAWFTEMSSMGWRWDNVFDEPKKTHPGMDVGELTRGGTRHWAAVVERVRATARRVGTRMTGL